MSGAALGFKATTRLPRVAWVGSRDHPNLSAAWQLVTSYEPCTVVSGGARDIDTVAEEAQLQRGGEADIHRVSDADWKALGKRAGHIRNGRMVASGLDVCHAFPFGEARGTRNMMAQCRDAGVPVIEHHVGAPSLLIQSARMGYRGRDALDVTRKSGKDGLFLAPSWAIIKPVIELRKQLDALLEDSCGADPVSRAYAEEAEQRAWEDYVPKYREEMLQSWRTNRRRWDALLMQRRVILLCFCSHDSHCHRHLLRTMLVKAGVKIGRRVFDGGDLDWAKWPCKPWASG